jgi:hypothetical protein
MCLEVGLIENVGLSGKASDLYSGDGSFESRLGHQLSRLEFFVIFPTQTKQMPEWYFKFGHDRFLPCPFQFIQYLDSSLPVFSYRNKA